MARSRKPRPLFVFYLLVIYVFMQFAWWTIMLVKLNNEIHDQRVTILRLKSSAEKGVGNTLDISAEEKELQQKLHVRWWMIIGEGTVFLALLSIGVWRTRSSFRKEKELAERQKNFLLSVTHELKSPLASIKLQLETLKRHDLPDAKKLEMHNDALEDIERLHTLVENILIAARIDRDDIVLHKENFNLSEVTAETAQRAFTAWSNTHRLEIDAEAGIFSKADRVAFPSVLINLLENAVKYSPEGSVVTVKIQRRKNNMVALQVIDRGIGISAGEKEKVFGKFYRSGNEETRTSKGTGLGLFIVRHLADAHGWSISISDTSGGGATFTILLPEISIQKNS